MISAGRVLLMPRGAYNPSTTYEMLDIVSYNGSSYIAKGTTTGNLPTDSTYWQLSAYGGQAANIAGNFAEIETSSIATSVHYENDIFVDENSQLMKATQTINIGDTIDENTNCTPTTVEALINYLSSYVDSLDSLNKKIQGAIEIAAQTDLHSLALGEYYKSQTSFYVTNAPVGIDQEASAKFRLTVEAGLADASQASSPLLLTLRTPDGKIYTQGFDGTIWKSWEQIAVKSGLDARVDAVENSVADVETSSTASKAYAIGESFYYNDVLYKATAAISQGGTITPGTNCTPEKIIEKIDDLTAENQTLTNEVSDISDEIADMNNVLGAKNLLPNNATTRTGSDVTFTVNDDGSISLSGTATSGGAELIFCSGLHLDGNYVISGNPASSSKCILQLYTEQWAIDLQQSGDTELAYNFSNASSFYARIWVHPNQNVDGITIKPMIRPASIQDSTYVPYSMTNREITPYVQAISNPNLLDNPWFTVNQRGFANTTDLSGYTVDRWKIAYNPNGKAISLTGGVFTLDNSSSSKTLIVAQIFENNDYAGRDVTASVKLSNDTIVLGSAKLPRLGGSRLDIITSDDFNIYAAFDNNSRLGLYIEVKANKSVAIKAIKLELGSVSTLAMDAAPNYATELLKCQRYFTRLKPINWGWLGVGVAWNESNIQGTFVIPTEMRSDPNVITHGVLQWYDGTSTLTIDTFSTQTIVNNTKSFSLVLASGQSVVLGPGGLILQGEAYIDLSADL